MTDFFLLIFIIMKKVIRLTESDLTRIVKRVIKENLAKDNLIQMIKDDDIRSASEMVGGFKNLSKVLIIDTPMDFLHLFDDLGIVQSKEKKDCTLFRYKPKHNLMIYDRKNEVVHINYYEIWSVLEVKFGLNYSEIEQLTKDWLSEVYNLRGVTTLKASFAMIQFVV